MMEGEVVGGLKTEVYNEKMYEYALCQLATSRHARPGHADEFALKRRHICGS